MPVRCWGSVARRDGPVPGVGAGGAARSQLNSRAGAEIESDRVAGPGPRGMVTTEVGGSRHEVAQPAEAAPYGRLVLGTEHRPPLARDLAGPVQLAVVGQG